MSQQTETSSEATKAAAPTLEQMRLFLRARYKHERFEGRNAHWPSGVPEGGSYSDLVARNALADLAQHGHRWISRHESVTGDAVKYDAAAVIAAATRA